MGESSTRRNETIMIIRINKRLLKEELLQPRILIGGVIIAGLYIAFSVLILNYRLIADTLTSIYPLSQKLLIFKALLLGVARFYSPSELVILISLGFLLGVNMMLLMPSVKEIVTRNNARTQKKNGLSFGLGIVGLLATSGCASCGLTLFSLMGPTVSLSVIPFQGIALQGVSMVLLVFSLVYTMNRKNASCFIAKA